MLSFPRSSCYTVWQCGKETHRLTWSLMACPCIECCSQVRCAGAVDADCMCRGLEAPTGTLAAAPASSQLLQQLSGSRLPGICRQLASSPAASAIQGSQVCTRRCQAADGRQRSSPRSAVQRRLPSAVCRINAGPSRQQRCQAGCIQT